MNDTIEVNGKTLPWLFVERGFQIPSFNFDIKTEEVPGRDGAVYQGRQLKQYEFEIPLFIHNDYLSSEGVKTHDEILNRLVKFFDYDKAVKLKFKSQQWYWNAYFKGPIELKKETNQGINTFEMNAVLVDPYKYEDKEYQTPAYSDQIAVNNTGTAKTYPIIQATALKNSASFTITKNDEDYFMIGEEDAFKGVKDKSPRIYMSGMDNVAGWQYLPTGYVMQDNITSSYAVGSIESTGYQVRAKDYGTAPTEGWHGPAVKRSLPRTVQDFEFTGVMKIFSRRQGVGKGFFHFYDEAGNIIASAGLLDATNSKTNVKAYVALHNEYQERFEWYANTGNWAYDNAYVYLNIKRIGTTWYMKTWHYYTDKNGKKQITSRAHKTFNDSGKWYTAPIAQIGINISKHSRYDALPVYVDKITMNELLSGKEIPYIIKKGDEVYIDMQNELVLINNEDVLNEKTLGSDYFSIDEGVSELFVLPQGHFDTKAIWSNRFL